MKNLTSRFNHALWNTGLLKKVCRYGVRAVLIGGGLTAFSHWALAAVLPIEDASHELTSSETQILQDNLAQVPGNRVKGIQSVVIQTQTSYTFEPGKVVDNKIVILIPDAETRKATPFAFAGAISNSLSSYAMSNLTVDQKTQLSTWYQAMYNSSTFDTLFFPLYFRANYGPWYSNLDNYLSQASLPTSSQAFEAAVQQAIFMAVDLRNRSRNVTTSLLFSGVDDPSGQKLRAQVLPLIKADDSLTVGDYVFKLSSNTITQIQKNGSVVADGLSITLADVTLKLLAPASGVASAQRTGSNPTRRSIDAIKPAAINSSVTSNSIGDTPLKYKTLNSQTAQEQLNVLRLQQQAGKTDMSDPRISAHNVRR